MICFIDFYVPGSSHLHNGRHLQTFLTCSCKKNLLFSSKILQGWQDLESLKSCIVRLQVGQVLRHMNQTLTIHMHKLHVMLTLNIRFVKPSLFLSPVNTRSFWQS